VLLDLRHALLGALARKPLVEHQIGDTIAAFS
jgi:hypothetical protein